MSKPSLIAEVRKRLIEEHDVPKEVRQCGMVCACVDVLIGAGLITEGEFYAKMEFFDERWKDLQAETIARELAAKDKTIDEAIEEHKALEVFGDLFGGLF